MEWLLVLGSPVKGNPKQMAVAWIAREQREKMEVDGLMKMDATTVGAQMDWLLVLGSSVKWSL